MTYLQAAEPEILIHGVADPGSPNFERVLLWVTGPMSLNGFAVTLATQAENGRFFPIFDNCFWFPSISTTTGTWIVLYTKRGTTEWSQFQGTPVLNLFWQRSATVFNRSTPSIVPLLFRVDAAVGGQLL